MKSSLVMVAVLPLAVAMVGCGEAPEGEDVAETSGAQSASQLPPISNRPPLQYTALIDFDTSPAGAVASGAIVDGTYGAAGVTFTCVYCTSGHAYAALSATGNNAVSLFAQPSDPGFDARWGAVKASFGSPRSSVSIDATAVPMAEDLGPPVARPFLEAFDAAGNFIPPVVYYPFAYGAAGYGTPQTLTVTSSTSSIAYVLFSSQAPGGTGPVYGVFDNLRFNTARPLLF
jgi:hypothetical protein